MEEKILTVGDRKFKVVPELHSVHNEPKDFRGCFDVYEEDKKVGSVAFNHSTWEFHDTEHLNSAEQLELADGIYYGYTADLEQIRTPDHPEFHPFYMQGMYHGGMESFEILPKEESFDIAYDGKIIAEIVHREQWQQIAGETLPEDLFDNIIYQIEKHYS